MPHQNTHPDYRDDSVRWNIHGIGDTDVGIVGGKNQEAVFSPGDNAIRIG